MKNTAVEVNKHRIELSNLDKTLYPDDRILKAEVIEYYLKIAPTMLRHIKGRPLSLVRYPDGISGEAFFQKQRPDWTPDWIRHSVIEAEAKTDYLIATREADLVWLANLACIELHQTNGRAPHFDKPDYMAFDLDPPEKYEFVRVIDIALRLKEHIESYGYHGFAKTSGGKGVHLFIPIEPDAEYKAVADAAQDIAQRFLEKHGSTTTLQLKKEARHGKLLIDIYRNRHHQTTVCPYSLRGRPGAPVSMPLTWKQMENLADPSRYNLKTAIEAVRADGDAWEGMGAHAIRLHSLPRPAAGRKPAKSPAGKRVPKQLQTYAKKRSFIVTPEPGPEAAAGAGDSFVIHRHHATRLHYDLRLEQEGVLKSWAVPKGLPPRPGVKRLAVATEDHPLSYLGFEGTIPKGEYGAGPVWVFATGKYEIIKEKKDSFHFRLHSRVVDSEFILIHTKEKDWLLDCADTPQVDWLHEPIRPMLSQVREHPFDDPDYLYEIKWDGIRALVALEDGRVTIRSRNYQDITAQFPELQSEGEFRASCGLFDAEIVCLDRDGKPIFEDVLTRMQQTGANAVARAQSRHPATCYIFDCLYLDGCVLTGEPLERRRAWMADSLRPDKYYRISEAFDDGKRLFDAAAGMGLEGIVAKKRNSRYLPGKRSDQWLKIKAHRSLHTLVIGYTAGKGGREAHFGALHLGCWSASGIRYLGKVGSGFDERKLDSIGKELLKTPRASKPVKAQIAEEAQTVWLEPQHVCEVRYSSTTKEGVLRDAVFVRMRPDLTPEDLREPESRG